MMQRPVRVLHLITGLDIGGAETMLANLARLTDRRRFETTIVSLSRPGAIGAQLQAEGVAVRSLDMPRGFPAPRGIARLVRLLWRQRIDVLQTWLYHADLLGAAAALVAPVPHLVWNLRSSEMDVNRYGALTAFLARMSRRPAAVLTNSEAGQRAHARLGYRPRRWEVIPNGFDIDRFRPDPEARARLRAEFGLPPDGFVVCLPARFDPMKDHETFLAAAAIFAKSDPAARFLLVGPGVDSDNANLRAAAARTGCAERIVLLGVRRDMPQLLAGTDAVVSSSAFGEGFSNVLGEAMACGVPVVATDVGDAARIVADTGFVVAPRDPTAMAAAWRRLAELGPSGRARLGTAARQRIADNFSLPAIVKRYEAVYAELAGRGRADGPSPSRQERA